MKHLGSHRSIDSAEKPPERPSRIPQFVFLDPGLKVEIGSSKRRIFQEQGFFSGIRLQMRPLARV